VNNDNYEKFYDEGYQIIPNFITPEEAARFKSKSIDICKQQAHDFGIDNINSIDEQNIARSPFLFDSEFENLFYNQKALQIVSDILGEYAILSLQNSIIVPPNDEHHQSFYHRDIIYQEFISSRPLAINLYYCLDDYDEQNGGTAFIPESHKQEKMISESNSITPIVKAGSVILFNSMTFHKAGINKTSNNRCGVNNMYTLPFVKQQINYPNCYGPPTEDLKLNRLLGYQSREFNSVRDFREYRLKRTQNDK
jgi:ectoine hydroxylase-related dioxygenase (phytanoyl-CoA dioxygenase family)